jgi:hypothetical protein
MNSIKLLGLIIIISVSSSGCHRESLSKDVCQTLLFKTFKGFPLESKKFKSNCLNYDLEYTMKTCKEALNAMIMGKGKNAIVDSYGGGIFGCFSKNDISKFLMN